MGFGHQTKRAASKWLSVVYVGSAVKTWATAKRAALLSTTEYSRNSSTIELIVDSGLIAEACLGRSRADSSDFHLQTPSSNWHNYALLKIALLKMLLMTLNVTMAQAVRRYRSQQASNCQR